MSLMSVSVHAQINELKRMIFEMNSGCPIETNVGFQITSCEYADGYMIIKYTSNMLDISLIKDVLEENKEEPVAKFFQSEGMIEVKDLLLKTNTGLIYKYQGINNSSYKLIYSPEQIKKICERESIPLEGVDYIQHFVAKQNQFSETSIKLLSNYGVIAMSFALDKSYLYSKYTVNDTSNYNRFKDGFDVNSYFENLKQVDANLGVQMLNAGVGFCLIIHDNQSGKEAKTFISINEIKKRLSY